MRALVVAGLCAWLAGCGPSLEQKGREQAASLLRDPSSAQFRNVQVKNIFVCGEINGKNGFGAYNGFTKFYATEDSATIDPDKHEPVMNGFPSESEVFARSYKAYCS